jgi:hypothetical protein
VFPLDAPVGEDNFAPSTAKVTANAPPASITAVRLKLLGKPIGLARGTVFLGAGMVLSTGLDSISLYGFKRSMAELRIGSSPSEF